MKILRKLSAVILVIYSQAAFSQQLLLGKAPFAMNKSAVLELNSDNQGFLLPRITDTTLINALTPPNGMIIYYVPGNQLLLRTNGFWKSLSLSGNYITALSGDASAAGPGSATTTVTGLRGVSLPGLSAGFLKYNGASWVFDNNTYLTANQSITWTGSGDVSGTATSATSLSPALTVNGLKGAALPVLSPGLLKYNGTSWVFDNSAYLTGNQTITLSGDVSGSGTTSIVTAIGSGKVANFMLAGSITSGKLVGTDIATVGTITTGTWNGTAITSAYGGTGFTSYNLGDILYGTAAGTLAKLPGNTVAAKRFLTQTGTGTTSAVPSWGTITSADVSGLGSLAAAGSVDLGTASVTGTLPASKFGALTGDVTTPAGSYATTIAGGAVTYAKMQNVSATGRLLGRASAGAGVVEEITLGTGLSFTGTTLNVSGISGTANYLSKFTGTGSTLGNSQIFDNGTNVGIGNAAPAQKLDINGNLAFSGALMPGGSAGTNGYILQSNGPGSAPSWMDPSAVTGIAYWAINGNTITGAPRQFGTRSNHDLPFITNDIEKMRLTATGRLGIGTTTPATTLDVAGTVKLGSNGSAFKNIAATEYSLPATTVTAGSMNTSLSTFSAGTTDVTVPIAALSSTRGSVSISFDTDLPASVSVAYARVSTTTQVTVRFLNNSTTAQSIAAGTKVYITVVEF